MNAQKSIVIEIRYNAIPLALYIDACVKMG